MSTQPALLGGEPLFPQPVEWDWPPRTPEQGELLKSYYNSGAPLSVQGCDGIIASCEDVLKKRLQRRCALLCSSGTMALYSAYFALNLKPGDEIVCPAITYHATATPALHLGAHVVLVDTEPDTGNISLAAAENAITDRTVAVASNAMWGHPIEQQAMRNLCDKHHLAWVEDFSHAHFSTYKNRPVGSFGDIACASLQGKKFISGGEGGILLTDNETFYRRAVALGHNLRRCSQLVKGTELEPIGRTGFGLKLRCHPLAALIIHHQTVHYADKWMQERHDTLTHLSAELAELPGLKPPIIKPYVTSMGAWYGYKPKIMEDELRISAGTIAAALRAEGVDADLPGSPPLHHLPIFDPDRFMLGRLSKHDNRSTEFPGVDEYARGRLSLPTPTGERDALVVESLLRGFNKIWEHLDILRDYENHGDQH